MKTKTIILLALTLVALAGCAQQEEQFTVGAIVAQTGILATPNQDVQQGMQLAIEELNPNIKVIFEDSKSNPKDGVTAAQKLLNTKDLDMLISLNSAVSVPVAKLAEEHKIPIVASLVVANEFAGSSPYTFRHYTTAKKDAEQAVKFLKKQNAESVAVIHIENEYGQSARDQFSQIYEGDIAIIESFEGKEVDFATTLLKIKESGADWIYLLGYPSHNIKILDQKRELGINIPLLGNSPLTEINVVEHMKDTDEVFYGTNFLGADVTLPRTQEFIKKFENRFGRKPDLAAFGYDLIVVADAVQKSGKDPLIALNEIEVEGVNGRLKFDENGDSNPENIMYKVEKGKLTRVD